MHVYERHLRDIQWRRTWDVAFPVFLPPAILIHTSLPVRLQGGQVSFTNGLVLHRKKVFVVASHLASLAFLCETLISCEVAS